MDHTQYAVLKHWGGLFYSHASAWPFLNRGLFAFVVSSDKHAISLMLFHPAKTYLLPFLIHVFYDLFKWVDFSFPFCSSVHLFPRDLSS